MSISRTITKILKKIKDYFRSITMCLLQIGELANHLSDELLEKYPDIPWARIVGLRNVIAHGYGRLDYETIWNTSHIDVLELMKKCQEIITS